MKAIGFRSPLLPLSAVAASLGCDVLAAKGLVESGEIAYAWDISTRRAQTRCIRVLASCLATVPMDARARAASDATGLEAALTEIIPSGYDPTAVVVGRRFCCSARHVHSLILEGSLKVSRPGSMSRGWDSSPRICRVSLQAFLKARRVA